MGQVSSTLANGLEQKIVLAVKDASNEQGAQPAQLAFGPDGKDCRLEAHRGFAGRSDLHRESSALLEVPRDGRDEGIPRRHPGETGQKRPDPRGGGIDLDVSFDAAVSHWA